MRAEYDDLAAEYDARWASYIRPTTGDALRQLALRPGERQLDVGCGTGLLLEQARSAAHFAVGVDLSPRMLATARRRLGPHTPLVAADVGHLPFRAATFDAVVSTSALHFWPEPERALAEIARVLRPHGRLVLTDWCADYLSIRLLGRYLRLTGRAFRHIYTAAECLELLKHHGFNASVTRRKIGWLWGIMTVTATRASPGQ